MPRTAVVISFDRLHLGSLGPYGNDWIETPELNGLAAEAVVFDQCLGEPRSPEDPSHGWWQDGQWLRGLRDQGVPTRLLTDVPTATTLKSTPGWTETRLIEGREGPEYSETEGSTSRLMTEAGKIMEQMARRSQGELLWVRSRGIARPWLPPQEFVDLYLEEFGLARRATASTSESDEDSADDEAVSGSFDDEEEGDGSDDNSGSDDGDEPAGSSPLPEDSEPEEVLHLGGRDSDLPYVRAMHAASVSHLDRWLVRITRALARFKEPPLLILTAAHGEELGEHGEPGANVDDPYSPNLHVPLIICWPGHGDGSRRPALVTVADVAATLCEWFGIAAPASGKSLGPIVRNEADTVRDEVRIATADHLALRTNDAYYVRRRSGTPTEIQESAELFEKPADRWDLANRAMLAPGIVDELDARLLSDHPTHPSDSAHAATSPSLPAQAGGEDDRRPHEGEDG